MILKSLLDVKAEKLIILVSHRQSTMAICDQVIGMKTAECPKLRQQKIALLKVRFFCF